VADVDRVAQIEVLGQVREVGSPVVHVVAGAGLVGPAVAAPVVGDHPVALAKEEGHLGVPVVRRQRPAVAENDRLA
jgi:hypothetical protein